ncbi:MAG TPA: hypothetical protein VGH87_02245 [Polyangiaceae bacterium]
MPPTAWEVDAAGAKLVIDLQSNNAGTEFYASIQPFRVSVTARMPAKFEETALDDAIRAYEEAGHPPMPWDEIKRALRADGAFGH